MTPLEFFICLLLISVSAFMSASEIALFSLSRFQLRSLKERFSSGHRKMKRLLADPGGLLITILVVNEIVNISLSAIITGAFARYHQTSPSSLSRIAMIPTWAIDTIGGLLLTAPIVLFLCEITPKVIAARANQLIASLTIGPLGIIYDSFRPIRQGLKQVVKMIARRIDRPTAEAQKTDDSILLKESDFLLMIEEGHKEGAIHENELELIKNVFDLDDTTTAEVLTPLSQVRTLPATATLKTALATMRGTKFSRIPVMNSDKTKVIGVIHSKDLLHAKLEPESLNHPVEEIMHKPMVINSNLRLNAVFRKFKQHKTHLAVVQDAQGSMLGVVTMSDVLGALFDDLFPEEKA